MERIVNGSVILSLNVILKEIIVRMFCMEVNALVLMAFMDRIVRKFVIVTDILVTLKLGYVGAKMDFQDQNVK
jgi:hypothetical protein